MFWLLFIAAVASYVVYTAIGIVVAGYLEQKKTPDVEIVLVYLPKVLLICFIWPLFLIHNRFFVKQKKEEEPQ